MSAAKPDDLQPRDKMLARLLADALPTSPDLATCPDPEILAAYADRNLSTEEAAHLETHFADCARCQKMLAMLALSAEELPVRKAVPAPVSISAPRAMPRPAQPTRWRQLAPALGIAAAVALWFALRPAPPAQTVTSQLAAPQSSAAQPATQSNAQNNSEVAENIVPPPPAPLPASPAANAPSPPQESKERSAPTLQAELRAPASAAASPNPEASSAASGSPAAKAEPQQSLSAEQTPAGIVGGIFGAGTLSAQADTSSPAFAPNAASPASEDKAKPAVAANGIAAFSARPKALTKVEPRLPVFASPNREALWRMGTGGSIERSTDQGATWQAQTSGVSSDLVAGAAASREVAWIVGRAGVILRTTDGIRWQRVALLPEATGNAALDLTGVEVRDALHATVTATNGHRFTTSDGGQTWTQQ